MPVMRKPASKRPAACTEIVPYKKAKSEMDEDEQEMEEEQEEEEENEEENETNEQEEDDKEQEEEEEEKAKDAKPAKKQVKLSKEALENHHKFVQEAAKKGLSQEVIDQEMKRASSKTQMSLWKAFESSRLAEGEQEGFLKASGSGVGSQKKKRRMLSSWIMDGGKCTKHYKQAIQTFTLSAPWLLGV